MLDWQAEARKWLDKVHVSARPPPPPSGDNDSTLYALREVFSGSAQLSQYCSATGLSVRRPVDFNTKWNLLWPAHQEALLVQIGREPAQVLWMDPPGAGTTTGNAIDHELARFVTRLARTQIQLGYHVVVDATAGSHFWRQPAVAELERLENVTKLKYSWCGLGAAGPITNRPWHRIRTVLTTMPLEKLCIGWEKGVFRPECCSHPRTKQATRKRFQKDDRLDRNKASREYPVPVITAIGADVASQCDRTRTNEKYNQSKKGDINCSVDVSSTTTAKIWSTEVTKKKAKPPIVPMPDEVSGDCGDDYSDICGTALDADDKLTVREADFLARQITSQCFIACEELAVIANDFFCSFPPDLQEFQLPRQVFFEDVSSLTSFLADHHNVLARVCELRSSEKDSWKINTRWHAAGCVNYWLFANVNMREQGRIEELRESLMLLHPQCVTIAPPSTCTTEETMQELADLWAMETWWCAKHQYEAEQMFVVDGFSQSGLWDAEYWQDLYNSEDIYFLRLPLDPDITVVSNERTVVESLVQSTDQAISQGYASLEDTERRPAFFCEGMSQGVDKVFAYPTQEEFTAAKCKACRGRKRKDHPSHTRVEGECLYPHAAPATEPDVWSKTFDCPACKGLFGRYDPGHTLRDDHCRWSVKQMSERLTRAEASDITPRIRTRTMAPIIPLNIRGSPGDPAAEEDEAETDPVSATAGPSAGPAPPTPPVDASIAACPAATEEELRAEAAAVGAEIPAEQLVPSDDEAEIVGGEADEEEVGDVSQRRKKVKKAEMGTQATDSWDAPDWSRFDLGKALNVLRTGTPGAIKRVLQRLHIRNYHQPALQLKALLQAAGVSEKVLQMVDAVVKGCRICQMWVRPPPKSIAAVRMSTKFNEVMQADLLFIFGLAILHCVDEATRWSAVIKLKSRAEDDILDGFHHVWIKIWGRLVCLSLIRSQPLRTTQDKHVVNDTAFNGNCVGLNSMLSLWSDITN